MHWMGLFQQYFLDDPFKLILVIFIGLVSLLIQSFSFNYLRGTQNYSRFFIFANILFFLLVVFILSDSFRITAISLFLANIILTLLMEISGDWKEASLSAKYARKFFSASFLLIVTASFFIKTDSIQAINSMNLAFLPCLLIVLAACIQSAIFPFHKWLMSSLNSPTPVSALMHAGLINGGGLLLIKLNKAILTQPIISSTLFIVALISTVISLWWILVRPDIKTNLAASTVSQMSMMLMQISLGLLPAAITHVILHGLYKSFCFLNSGSKIYKLTKPNLISFPNFIFVSIVAFLISYAAIPQDYFSDSRIFIFISLFFFVSQSLIAFYEPIIILRPSISLLQSFEVGRLGRFVLSMIFAFLAAKIYSYILWFIDHFFLDSLYAESPIGLNFLQLFSLFFFILNWLAINLIDFKKISHQSFFAPFYLAIFNMSSPSLFTISTRKRIIN